jgi:hypothetical protein
MYKVTRHLNDAPVPAGMARNSRFTHGVKIQPEPPMSYEWRVEEVIKVTATYGFTDCLYADSFTVFWTEGEVTDQELAAISKALESDRTNG